MKEFDGDFHRMGQRPAAEIRQITPQKYDSSLRPHPGHRVWEFDLSSGDIQEAKVESSTVKLAAGDAKTNTLHKKIIQRPDCLYCSALNKKNAIKKFVPVYDRLIRRGIIAPKEKETE